ncbi:MAG: hypothetical protein WDO24_13915 [Pseudomonadota bacterium]
MHVGYDAGPVIGDADAVLVVDCDVPLDPDGEGAARERQGDPARRRSAVRRYPIRGFPADVAITGSGALAVELLDAALREREQNSPSALALTVDDRRAKVGAQRAAMRARWAAARDKAAQDTEIQQAWASACIDRARDDQTIVINEYTLALDQTSFTEPLSYFSHSPTGGLGWGLARRWGPSWRRPRRP